MKTNIIVYMVTCFLVSALSFSGCKDPMDEITAIDVNRAFSPTDLTAIVVNKTGVKLTWDKVKNADSYTVEIYDNADFSGTPAKSVSDITFDQVPYTITGLDGDIEYSVRVKAVGNGIDDSKWITATFTTDPEQIFQEINTDKLEATSVTLNWTAGETATTIVLTPGDITHTVTSGEITAGEATITGLTGETTYTAKLMNGTKVRGTITFTTLLDVGDAIIVNPSDDLATIISNAAGGETFALTAGTYTINSKIDITKTISLKGAVPSSKPIIQGIAFNVKAGAGLTLKDLVLDGSTAGSTQLVNYDEDLPSGMYGNLTIQGCEVTSYTKGFVYINKAVLMETMTMSDNLIHDITCSGGGFIDFRKGFGKTFLFENNTVYNITEDGSRDLFRIDNASDFTSQTSVITIQNNTFYNALNRDGGRYLYVRCSNQISVVKNIIANSLDYYANQSATNITTFSGNNYFNASNFTGSTASGAKNDTGTFTTLDPGFANAAAGDFTISNIDLKANGVGAARWR